MTIDEHITKSQELLEKIDNLSSRQKLEEYLYVYKERVELSKKLDAEECWYGILNIYYSCFTLILGVLSLTNTGKFLSLPSVLFTIILTFLVIYSNSQRRHARSVDLRANCTDFEKRLFRAENKVDEADTNSTFDEEIQKIAEECINLRKDSESPVNIWNALDKGVQWWIGFLIAVPIIYIIICACFNSTYLYLFFSNPH